MKRYLLSKTLVLTTVLMLGLAIGAMATVTVTAAAGGTGISADKALNASGGGTYTTLSTSISIADNASTDFARNQSNVTFVLTAPANWNFKAGVGTVARVGSTVTSASIVVTATTITVTYTTGSTANNNNSITINGIQVIPVDGSLVTSLGNILRTSGTGTIAGFTNGGGNNCGSLSIVGGAATSLNITSISSPQTINNNFSIMVSGTDQFGNTASGTVALTTSAGAITPATATLGTATNVSENTAGTNRTITATAGSAFVTSNQFDVLSTATTDYFRSQASTSWSTISTWQSSHDSSVWFTATAIPTASAKRVTILNNVTISTVSVTASNIIINSGGSLTINGGRTLTLNSGSDTALYVLGIVSNAGTITLSSGALIAVDNGGVYNHAESAGTVPAATWNTGSTCIISAPAVGGFGTNTAPGGLNQHFYNFTWSSNNDQNQVDLNSALTTINGTFTYNASANSTRLATNGALTLNIGGNFIIASTSSAFLMRFLDGTANPVINIGGDFDVQGGSTTFDAAATGEGKVTLNVTGNVNITGGTLDPNDGSTTAHVINVGGNWNLNTAGTFTVGSLGVVFNGSSLQTIGGTKSTAFNNLTINNTNGNVTLNIAASVSNTLAFTNGKLDASAFTLSLGSAITGNANAITGVGANSYIITGNGSGNGKLTVNRIASGSAYTFPIGTSADYLPASVNPNTANLNWSASVFNPATTDAAYGSGNNFTGTSLGQIVNAIWVITPSNPATTATLTLNWTSDLEGSYFVEYTNDNIGISHYNSTVHVWQNSTATGGADNSLNTVTSQFTSFSPFGVGSIGSPLPITIINYKAILNSNNTVGLTWQTTVEENSDHFDVERSSDGSNWNIIGTIAAQGNSEIVTNYSYLDASPKNGANYYRLNMFDKNGSHSYSNVEIVTMNSVAPFSIFPNPAKNFVNVTLGRVSGNSTIRLFSFSGQTVFTQQFNNENGNTVSIPVQNLAQGTYMLQVSGSDGLQHTGKVIIGR